MADAQEVYPGDDLTLANNLHGTVQYRGRKAARAKSEYRRRQILEAALRILARDGIRGVKHRPVAKEAGVPLASTTYYFRDLDELIGDAFALFAEKAQGDLDNFYARLNRLLDSYPEEVLDAAGPGREMLAKSLTTVSADYISELFVTRRREVLAEQVLLLEALRDARLAEVAQTYRSAWALGLEQVLGRLHSPNPGRDATMLVSVVFGLGYDGLLFEKELERAKLQTTLERLIGLVLGTLLMPSQAGTYTDK
ncbi:TetR/AcrR family transcriptional regulator [Marinobacter salicampi]|uniref:TetR/AcrR family transcriptional regulator n=1 Tax=Marinobacter salicampi TaxID=435907 RepID=UPI00140B1B7E|nr:TetR family transcriptional regulator [Marinobacter salicampi]